MISETKSKALTVIGSSILVGALATMNVGCVAEADDADFEEGEPESTSAAIVGGQTTSGYSAVGALTYRGESFCTGTVVTRRAVVTAAHCLEDLRASSIRFVLGPNASSPQTVLGVSRLVLHPQYNSRQIRNDIGVLILSQDAPVTPIALNSSMSSSWVGLPLTFVGYGATNGYNERGSGVKREVSIPVSRVSATQFVYQSRTKNTCFGDSGGPAFTTDSNGDLVLVGVTSYGDMTCSQYGVNTRVDAYTDFIQAAIQ